MNEYDELQELEVLVRSFKEEWETKMDWDWADIDIPVEIKEFLEELWGKLL